MPGFEPSAEHGTCSAASPRASGAHLGAKAPPPPAPSGRGGQQRSGRRPGCWAPRPSASRRGESPRAGLGPAPRANKQRVARQPPPPSSAALGSSLRPGCGLRGVLGPRRLPQIRGSNQACGPGGHGSEGEGDSCSPVKVGRAERVALSNPDPPGLRRSGCSGQEMAAGPELQLRSRGHFPRGIWGAGLAGLSGGL